jgi:hypothetical protein
LGYRLQVSYSFEKLFQLRALVIHIGCAQLIASKRGTIPPSCHLVPTTPSKALPQGSKKIRNAEWISNTELAVTSS